MQVEPFYYEAMRVIQSGPWDPVTFGTVSVQVTVDAGKLEASIDLMTETSIQFEIDCYHWLGSRLYLTSRGATKWVFEALN
jgi:hypothetical protein